MLSGFENNSPYTAVLDFSKYKWVRLMCALRAHISKIQYRYPFYRF